MRHWFMAELDEREDADEDGVILEGSREVGV